MPILSNQYLKITKNGIKALQGESMSVGDRFFLNNLKKPTVVKDLYKISNKSAVEFEKVIDGFVLRGWVQAFDSIQETGFEEETVVTDSSKSHMDTQVLNVEDMAFTNDLNDIMSQIQQAQQELDRLTQQEQEANSNKPEDIEVISEHILIKKEEQKIADSDELDFLEQIDFEKDDEIELLPIKVVEGQREAVPKIEKANDVNPVVKPIENVIKLTPATNLAHLEQKNKLLKELERLKKMQDMEKKQAEHRLASIEKRKQEEQKKKDDEIKRKQDLLDRQRKIQEDSLKTVTGLAAHLKKIQIDKNKK